MESDHTWSLLLLSHQQSQGPANAARESESVLLRLVVLISEVMLNEALTSGEWSVDNSQLPQNLVSVCDSSPSVASPLQRRPPPQLTDDLNPSLIDLVQSPPSWRPTLIPVSSFENHLLSLQVVSRLPLR
jgi:glutamine synthetase adenylyltransferase